MLENEKYTGLLRLLFGTIAAYLLILGVMNFFRYATSTTDENWFRTSPSNLYVTKSFPATLSLGKSADGASDSVLVGDLLVAMNDHRFEKGDSLSAALALLAADSTFELKVLRPALDKTLTFEVSRAALPDSLLATIPPSVYIFEVIEGGASELAGIQPGDVVFRINEQFFKDAQEADLILRQAESGATITYNLLRSNRVLTIPVTLVNFGVSWSALMFVISGLVYLGIGAFIVLSRPDARAAQLVGLAFMGTGFFMMAANQRDIAFDMFAKVRNATLVASFCFGIAFWLHSKLHFPQARPELLRRPWLYRILYFVAGICFVVFWLNLLKTQMAALLFNAIVLVIVLGRQAFIYFKFRRQRSQEFIKLRRPIFWAGWLAGAGAFLIALILAWNRRQQHFGFLGLPLLIIPLTYLYTIGRYQLLDIHVRLRRNLQYIIVSTIWIAALVVLALRLMMILPELHFAVPNINFTGTSIVIVDEPPPPLQRDFIEKLLLMIFAVALTLTTYKVGKIGQGFIDRRFFRERQAYNRAASELAEVMTTQLNLTELCRGIVRKLARLLRLKRVGILIFRDEKECRHHDVHGMSSEDWDEICLKTSTQLIEAIQKFRSESRFSIDYLPNDLKETFLQFGMRHVIPLRYKEKLVGALLVGEKLSEVPATIEDLTFLATVAKQSAVAIENAFLHESLAEQERMKHELELARRIQMASLPQRTPEIPGLDIAGVSVPALEVGGDYFDYLNGQPDEITIIVGDVSGKGTSAALYMSKIQGILRSLNQFNLSPRELFIRANQLLAKDLDRSSFVTAIGAAIDSGKRHLILARAGHLPLFYYHAKTGRVELVVPKGLGLGLDKDETFAAELEEQVIHYDANDVFLFVTDGVTEAKTNNGLEFGEEKLTKILEASSALNAYEIRDCVLAEVKRFAGNSLPHDDQTVVVVKALNR